MSRYKNSSHFPEEVPSEGRSVRLTTPVWRTLVLNAVFAFS